MIDQTNATFQEVFSRAGLMKAIKLLPWCLSAVVPFCYIRGEVSIATQQDKGIPTVSEPFPTASEPEPHGLPVPGPSRGLMPPPGTSPLPVSSLPDMPLSGTPLVGCPFSNLLAILSQGKWDHSPNGSLDPHYTKRIHITSSKVEAGSEHRSTWGDDHMPNLKP